MADGLSFALRLVCWLSRLCPACGGPDLFPQRPPCSPLFPTLQPRHAVSLPWFFACLMSLSMLSSQLFCPHAWCVTGMPTTEFQRLGHPARGRKVSLGAFWLPFLATEGYVLNSFLALGHLWKLNPYQEITNYILSGPLVHSSLGSSPFYCSKDFPKYNLNPQPCTSVLLSKFPAECLYIISNYSKGFFGPSVAKLRGES